MADQNTITDTVRAKLSENLSNLRKASADYFQLLEKSLPSSQFPTADHAKQYFEYLQHNVTGTFDLCDKLIQAKDVHDVTRSQSEFFLAQMRALTDQANSASETAMKAVTTAFKFKN